MVLSERAVANEPDLGGTYTSLPGKFLWAMCEEVLYIQPCPNEKAKLKTMPWYFYEMIVMITYVCIFLTKRVKLLTEYSRQKL